jgi:hypothetical protein
MLVRGRGFVNPILPRHPSIAAEGVMQHNCRRDAILAPSEASRKPCRACASLSARSAQALVEV